MTAWRQAGAQPLPGGGTRFALWAPDAATVRLELADGELLDLRPDGDGWFVGEHACGDGAAYRFLIDDRLRVADPAARAQAGGVQDASLVLDHAAYRWQVENWRGRPWHETVLYELHVGLFDGFAALEAFLPALAELGVTAVELMPLGAFPGRRNWGYDGVLPFAPASVYGSPDALKHLIDRAHGLGLMVFVDVVYNHFGPQDNYLGHYAGAFFRDDLHTPWGNAIDFRRREVRAFFIDNALMWLNDYRVDGLRLDAVHAIGEKDFLVELAARVRESVDGRHVHLVLENEDNQASLLREGFDAQWNDDLHNALHALLTGEREGYYADFAEQPTRHLARCLGEGFAYQGEPDRRGQPRGEPSAGLPPTAFVSFLQNHDQVGNRAFGERLVSLVRPEPLRICVALQLLCPMIPLLFMGEDWGERRPFLYFTDFHGELADAVREGRRAEFREFGRFADADALRRIADPNAEETFAASRPMPAQADAGWREHYRRLLALRHGQIVPRLPGSRALGAEVLGDGAISAAWRLGDGSRLRIDFNLGEAAVAVKTLPARAALVFHEGLDVGQYRAGRLPSGSIAVSMESPQ
ncbi:Malto-oligosyltrehalose trehalohydrolase [compost metagenome]